MEIKTKTETTIDALLQKQRRTLDNSDELMCALREVPQASIVQVIPVDEQIGCQCNKSFFLPREAIKVVYELHKPVDCCGDWLEVVFITIDPNYQISAKQYVHLMLQQSR